MMDQETYSERMLKELGEATLKGGATRKEIYILVDQLLEKFAMVDDRLDAIEKSGVKFRGVY